MKRKIAGVISGVMVLAALTGCGESKGSEEAAYVKGLLDVAYNQGVEDYADITGIAENEAKEFTQQSLQTEAEVLTAYLGIPDASGEAVEMLTEFCGKMYEKASYQVDTKDDNVQVTIKPLDIFSSEEVEDYIDEYNKREFIDGDPSCTDADFVDGIVTLLEKELEDPSYEKEVKVEVSVEKDGESYSVSDEDLETIDSQIIAY